MWLVLEGDALSESHNSVQQVQHYVEARLTTELGLQLLLLATARASDGTSPRKSREFGLEAV